MIDVSIAAAGFCLLILMMALGFHVAVAMFAISIAGAVGYLGVPAALEYGTQLWGAGNNFVLTAIPLFVLLRSEERRVGKECRSRWSPYH